jgi:hypothetical protein
MVLSFLGFSCRGEGKNEKKKGARGRLGCLTGLRGVD